MIHNEYPLKRTMILYFSQIKYYSKDLCYRKGYDHS